MQPQLIRKYGYPVEIHRVETTDGYILEMHRISGSKQSSKRQGKRVAFLQHGLFDSSAGWILMGPQQGLGYMLADQGYDVWLGNVRGNQYSRGHKNLSPNGDRKVRRDFWDFSWHEIGMIDLPTQIDYILQVTGETKLHYIGHSQGTTAFFVMTSELPQYNDLILSMNALAPVAYMRHLESLFMWLFALVFYTGSWILDLLGWFAFYPPPSTIIILSEYLCNASSSFRCLVKTFFFLIGGFDSDQLDAKMLPVVLGHTRSAVSNLQLRHYMQLMISGYFRQFDFGYVRNFLKYKSLHPPSYKLSSVRAPVTLHYSKNDWLATPVDVQRLGRELGNVRGVYLIKDPNFNHFDFLWAINARGLVYHDLCSVMKRSEEAFETIQLLS